MYKQLYITNLERSLNKRLGYDFRVVQDEENHGYSILLAWNIPIVRINEKRLYDVFFMPAFHRLDMNRYMKQIIFQYCTNYARQNLNNRMRTFGE